MKNLILCLLLTAPSFAWSKTLYQVEITDNLMSGTCYSNQVPVASYDSREACSEAKQEKENAIAETAQIINPDRPAQEEITQWEHEGEAAKYAYFCSTDDEDFNRRLGRRLCDQDTVDGADVIPTANR